MRTEFYLKISVNRLYLLVLIYFGTSSLLWAQKSKVIGVFQLIENGKYEEAKGIIEDATSRKSTKKWPRTWYARGLLCQEAYKKGTEKKDKKLYELYPNQLYVAFSSFEQTRRLDKRGKYDKLLAPRYVLLANELIKSGQTYFNEKNYEEALRAYELALRIYKSPVLTIKADTNLLYNTALSAYKCKNWKVALQYLNELDGYRYSPNVPHLIFSIQMMQSDTVSANKTLLDGINNYKDNEQLVLLLVDLLYKKDEPKKAVKVLNDAFKKDSSNYTYLYAKGLLYQKTEDYKKAIDAYTFALSFPSDTLKIYTGIGTCYFNMGAEMDEKARTISNNTEYREVKEKSNIAFNSALIWLEKAYEMDKDNQELVTMLNRLYLALDKKDKIINSGP